MIHTKTDRRVQRTQHLLQESLVSLILEKRYDKITVQDIIDRANVGRSTFYAHYQDKEDLLENSFASLANDLRQRIEETARTTDDHDHTLHSLIFFRHAKENHRFYKAMLEGGGGELLLQIGQRHMQEGIQVHIDELLLKEHTLSIPLPIVTHCIAGALTSLLMWWLNNGMNGSPEKINEMFLQLIMPGVLNVLHNQAHEHEDEPGVALNGA